MNHRVILWITALLCLFLFGCQAVPTGNPSAPEATVSAAQTPEQAPSPAPTPEPRAQSGSLTTVLLDGKGLLVEATAYTFRQNDCIELHVKATNDNSNRATVWFLVSGLNGWDVKNQQQAMTVVPLDPGAAAEETVTFRLNDSMAKYLRIDALQEMTLSVEGYVDSSEYEYLMTESDILFPDADAGYVQTYGADYDTLLSNDFLTLGYCGQDAETGAVTLFCEVKTPAPGAVFRLYPIVNGVFDTEAYLALEKMDMGTAAKRLLQWTPVQADAGKVNALYAVGEGVEMTPAKLTLPESEGAQKADTAALPVFAENAQVCIRYEKETHRLYGENLTADTVLVLANEETFLLDGREVKANPQQILLFPGETTVFRISGRGKDAAGVERNITIQPESETLSAGWPVSAYQVNSDSPAEPVRVGGEDFSLKGR